MIKLWSFCFSPLIYPLLLEPLPVLKHRSAIQNQKFSEAGLSRWWLFKWGQWKPEKWLQYCSAKNKPKNPKKNPQYTKPCFSCIMKSTTDFLSIFYPNILFFQGDSLLLLQRHCLPWRETAGSPYLCFLCHGASLPLHLCTCHIKKKNLATFNKLKWSVGNSLLHYLLYYLLVPYLVT